MKKIIIILLSIIVILSGCSSVDTQDSINNDAIQKHEITGITVSYTQSEYSSDESGNTTYLTQVTLTNDTNKDTEIEISGFNARIGSTYYGMDETLSEFTPQSYTIAANSSITIPVYFTLESSAIIEEVMVYDVDYNQYIFN